MADLVGSAPRTGKIKRRVRGPDRSVRRSSSREWGRSSGRANAEQRSTGDHMQRGRAAGVGEIRGARRDQRLGIGAQLGGRTGGAVLRIPEVAEQIVMLERRSQQNDNVYGGRQGNRPPPTTSRPKKPHTLSMIRPVSARHNCLRRGRIRWSTLVHRRENLGRPKETARIHALCGCGHNS